MGSPPQPSEGGAAPAAAPSPPTRARSLRIGVTLLGALLGAVAGGFLVVGMTLVLKAGIDFASGQPTWYILFVPVLGLAVAVLILQGLGTTASPAAKGRRPHPWRAFPPDTVRADISADVVETAGEEERFPWRLAPLRALAIIATVASGGAMGTEAPAAYLGVATGVCLGAQGGRPWRWLLRSAAVAGGAAGVGALMGIPLVGTAFILELGRRRRAPLSAARVIAALIGGFIGWGIDLTFDLSLIRLVVPKEPPTSFAQAVITACLIGALSGGISSLAGLAVYQAKKWKAAPLVRLLIGSTALVAIALVLIRIAAPSAGVGPGGGAILWAETVDARPLLLLTVCLLRAAATTAEVAAGGCGGVFIPFLAVGDLAGRVFAPALGVGNDLAGAAGAAGGISGGYRLPFTAAFMVLGVGGPRTATLTCLVTVVVAAVVGVGVESLLVKLRAMISTGRRQAPVQ